MIEVDLPLRELARLERAVKESGRKLPQEVAVAINATAKKVRSEVNKGIREELAVKKKDIDKTLQITLKATRHTHGAEVTLAKSRRIPLRDFGARQTRAGVSAKISKTRGRKTILGAFQGPKPGLVKASWRGHVFSRLGPGRLPIVKLFGPSPWGVYIKRGQERATKKLVEAELRKQLQKRIRFNVLKASGAI